MKPQPGSTQATNTLAYHSMIITDVKVLLRSHDISAIDEIESHLIKIITVVILKHVIVDLKSYYFSFTALDVVESLIH
jgi:hypothetical protein